MQSYQKAFIELALQYQALRFGEFTLKSGRLSPYFFNAGNLNSARALKILGDCYADAIHQASLKFDVVFGPAYKGIPLVCATSIALYERYQQDTPYVFNRKEAKDHGEGGTLIGAPLKGQVLIIDDVITAGTAIRESVELIQANSAKLSGIIVALDRQEKGSHNQSAIQEIATSFAIPVISIISFQDVLEYATQHADFSHYRNKLDEYRQQYGV